MSGIARDAFPLDDPDTRESHLSVVAGCVEGYRLAYPAADFAFARPVEACVVDGAPDLIAQMLDKLVANAVEFGAHSAIDIGLARAGDEYLLTVGNVGPLLPEAPSGHLFDSMVSMRTGSDAAEPHLGLGLYIVRLIAQFHGGSAQAANRRDGRGVVITVAIPAAN